MFDLEFEIGPCGQGVTNRQVLSVVDGDQKIHDISPHENKFTLRVKKGAVVERVAVRDANRDEKRMSPFCDCEGVSGFMVVSTQNPLRAPRINLAMVSESGKPGESESQPTSPTEPSQPSSENGGGSSTGNDPPADSTTEENTTNPGDPQTDSPSGDQPQTS